MFKSFFCIFLIFSVLLFTNCKSDKNPVNTLTREQKIKKYLNLPRMNVNEPAKFLVGDWEGFRVAPVLEVKRYALPSKLSFHANGTYDYSVKIGRLIFEANGTYQINENVLPRQIDLKQNYPRNENYNGIFDFAGEKILRISFFQSTFLPRPNIMDYENTQIFLKKN